MLDEIGRDMESPRPMHRMLQGEVGSGKTVVALATLLAAVGSGAQAAIMAPTEVLAEQLYMVLREMLSHAGLSPPVARRTGEPTMQMGSLFGAGPGRDGAGGPAHLLAGGRQLPGRSPPGRGAGGGGGR